MPRINAEWSPKIRLSSPTFTFTPHGPWLNSDLTPVLCMEGTAFTTFACLAERAARYQTIVRRSQMRKAAYTCIAAPANRTPLEAEGHA